MGVPLFIEVSVYRSLLVFMGVPVYTAVPVNGVVYACK